MANIVEISDFQGMFEIPRDKFSAPRFEIIRDDRQFELIYLMLGATLGKLFIDNLDTSGVPQDARFTAIYEPFVQDSGCEIVTSKGIKEMVKGYLYYFIVSDNNQRVAVGANVTPNAENSNINSGSLFIVKRYNTAIETAKAIQWFIGQNSADYPEYNGNELNFSSIY